MEVVFLGRDGGIWNMGRRELYGREELKGRKVVGTWLEGINEEERGIESVSHLTNNYTLHVGGKGPTCKG